MKLLVDLPLKVMSPKESEHSRMEFLDSALLYSSFWLVCDWTMASPLWAYGYP
jgi:hypothetical protein